MARITTTGQLRQFLADSILAVKDGSMKVHEALAIKKMAEEVNESLYAEVKVARLQKDLGEKASDFGNLTLDQGSSKASFTDQKK